MLAVNCRSEVGRGTSLSPPLAAPPFWCAPWVCPASSSCPPPWLTTATVPRGAPRRPARQPALPPWARPPPPSCRRPPPWSPSPRSTTDTGATPPRRAPARRAAPPGGSGSAGTATDSGSATAAGTRSARSGSASPTTAVTGGASRTIGSVTGLATGTATVRGMAWGPVEVLEVLEVLVAPPLRPAGGSARGRGIADGSPRR